MKTATVQVSNSMWRFQFIALIAGYLTLTLNPSALAEEWPGWRGPNHNGISSEADVPTKWGPEQNVHWKVPIPGVGHSSPIVWKDQIFVTTCVIENLQRELLCLDRETGRVLWSTTVATCPIEKMHRDNTPASATPVTDGQQVYVTFQVDGKIQISAYSLSGEHRWTSFPGSFVSRHGYCTSLVLEGEKLFVSGLQDSEEAFVAALDKRSGSTIWSTPRRDAIRSFSSPFPCAVGGKRAILLSGANQTVAYEQSTGKVLWEAEGPAGKTVSSIVACPDSGLAFVCGGRDKGFLALPLESLSTNESNWSTSKGLPYMTSPLASKGWLHIFSDEGIYRCYEAATGKVVNELRATGPVRASMVATEQFIYVTEKSGKTTVFKNDKTWTVVEENEIDEPVMASAAISNGDFILRSARHLLLIRD